MMFVFSEASAILLGPLMQLSSTSVKTLFDAPGATLSDPNLYTRLCDIPEQMPFEAAKAVYKTLLDEMEAYQLRIKTQRRRAVPWACQRLFS